MKLHLQFYLLMITNGLHNLDVMVKQLPFASELKKGESHLIASNFSSLYKTSSYIRSDGPNGPHIKAVSIMA